MELDAAKRHERGSAMLMVLLLLGLAAFFIAVVARSVSGAAIEVSAARIEAQTEVDVQIGIDLGAATILGSVDGMRSAETAANLAQGRIIVRVTNESGRVDLNTAPEVVIAGLLREAGADESQSAILAARLVKWRSSRITMSNGEEQQLPPTTAPINRALQHPWELVSILGYPNQLVKRLLPFVTVANSTGGIDPFVASMPVLLALPDVTPDHADDFLRKRDDNISRETALQLLGASPESITGAASLGWRLVITSVPKTGRTHHSEAVIAVIKKDTKPYRVLYVLNDLEK